MSSGPTSLKRRQQASATARSSGGKPNAPPLPQIIASAADTNHTGRGHTALGRRSLPAWLWSLAFHVAVLLVCMPLTFATLTGRQIALWAGPSERADEAPEPTGEVEIRPSDWQPWAVQQAAHSELPWDATTSSLSDLVETLPAGASLGDTGLAGVLPGDVGTLLSTGDGDGPGEGAVGAATFFGARSAGDRFVFVIDNSSSMKDGRLEAAVAELLRSVGTMSRRQSFYVIFVSDQPYPMFYPDQAADLLPATAVNKKRLGQWLSGLKLAPGDNRKLIEAMDLAASLRPHAVFFLWDGTLHYSERVRRDVMWHLARPNGWDFRVYTLGMGSLSADSEENLVAIAQAHGGTYQRVPVVGTKVAGRR